MFLSTSWLTRLLRRWNTSARPRRRWRPRRSPVSQVERLEPRQLLSALPLGSEFRVNTETLGSQRTNSTGQGGSMAMNADGDFVVTWSSFNQDGSSDGIYA